MAFVGYNNWYKGLPMLGDSLELLTPEVLRHIHLFVYAFNGEQQEPQLRRLEPRLVDPVLLHQMPPDRDGAPLAERLPVRGAKFPPSPA